MLQNFVSAANEFLWGPPMMIVLVGFGVFATLYLGFPQLKRFGRGVNHVFGGLFNKEATEEGSMSSFQSMATALAAQIGTGNIGGVAGALAMGGPGAIFWMWVTAIFGMATITVEATLAQKYRRKDKHGNLVGGPAYYLSQGFAKKGAAGFGRFLGGLFSILIVIALGFIGNMVQSNSISSAVSTAFNVPPIAVGIVVAIVAGLIFIGGVKRIGKFAETVVPFMAAIYIAAAIIALVIMSDRIIPTFGLIFSNAFSGQAVAGGVAGYSIRTAIRYGVARGLFSNEAGMGSTPNSHAVADVAHPGVQGEVAMIGVFIDTILVCSATGIIITAAGTYSHANLEGVMITMEAFSTAFGTFGSIMVAIALTFFALTTIIGWYFFGESNVKYLTNGSDGAIRAYQIIVIAFVVIGSLIDVTFAWELTDMFNGFMVIPNIIGLILLVPESKALFRDYDEQLASGNELTYFYEYQDQ